MSLKLLKTSLKHLNRLVRKYSSSSSDNHAKSQLLLETTQLKYLTYFNDSIPYVSQLVEESKSLLKSLTDLNDTSAFSTKGEQYKKLSFLKRVSELNEEIAQNELDKKELEKIKATETNEDKEMGKLVDDDLERLTHLLLEQKIAMVELLVPEENENKESALLELSAGVGGLESRIFCSELFEMYKIYAQKQNWEFNLRKVDTDLNEMGEMMRQARIEIEGQNVYDFLKFESGVHRVQRVPKTEAKGRIHTSTVGVVVTPKPEVIHIELLPKDLKIETKTSGGPGGQHANKTESAVRIVHLPTGIMVYNDEQRHMQQNRAKALSELQSKLYQKQFEDQLAKKQMNRKMQIGSSSRSERIRTYNYIQDRVTDHRLGENYTGVQRFLAAESLPGLIFNLRAQHQLELLAEVLDNWKNMTNKKS